jgi:serpin B
MAGALHAADRPVADLNRFATASYRQLANSRADNLILSPFNIVAALSMLLHGAQGQTAAEMASVLHRVYPNADYDAALASVTKSLIDEANVGQNDLSTANAVWMQSKFPIRSDYQEKMRTLFQASIDQLDFVNRNEQARVAINSWTAQHTKGKIVDLFPRGSLDPATRLIVTSAIHFYGKWQCAFNPRQTHAGPFQQANGSVAQIPFMNQTGRFAYAETPSAQILEMKYAGTPFAFDVILPRTKDGLVALEQSITIDKIAEWLGGLGARTVDVAMPKFRAESQFSLREALSKMGMPVAFTGSADFSGIDDRRDLVLSDVVHKAYVDVSEEGTEAAAATSGMVTMVAMTPSPRIVFRADHPFLFLIRDTRSAVILFAGRLTHPT